MKKLNKKIIKVLEKHDFSVEEIGEQQGGYYVDINQYTPEGEDWWETIWFDGTSKDFINSFKSKVDNFDIDEEVEVWVESRGKNGVPSSIKDLVEDAEWKLETLKKVFEDLKK